jgi:anti-anti-sigma factor
MEVTKRQVGDWQEVAVSGRLDAYWADHLSRALDEVIRGGARQVRLDLGEVEYLSSAGIRVLLKYYKQLKGSQGTFLVSDASAPVKMVLALAGFEELLGLKSMSAAAPDSQPVESAREQSRVRQLDRGTVRFEIVDTPFATLACRLVGPAEGFHGGVFSEDQCRTLQFPSGTMAVGLGALGHDVQDCRERFGHLMAVAGAVAYQPTDGRGVPDYQLQGGSFLPDVQILTCLSCEGPFAHLVRFETVPPAGPVPLSELVSACLEIAKADAAGMVLVAEAASLVGRSLERSPLLDGSAAPSLPPGGDSALAVTPCVTLAVGVAARAERSALASFLSPLGKRSWPAGNFHAAAFSPRPLMQGELDLAATVAGLFEEGTLDRILQLSHANNDQAGAQESRFVRGACWLGPIAEIESERMSG